MKKFITSILCTVLVFSTVCSITALAASFDETRRGSITLHYGDGDEDFEALEIVAYRVARVYSNGSFQFVAPFSDYPININNLKSQSEWKNAADTLASYIIADDVAPYCLMGTDNIGTVIMDSMETGLYLILGVNAEKDGTVYAFDNFFVVLPAFDSNGCNYDIEVLPKKEKYSGYLEYRVVKLWQDADNSSNRPHSITVDILCDGVYNETRTLGSHNNWTHNWLDNTGKGVWSVVEKDVPQGYSVTISQKGNVFEVINTYETSSDNEPENPPDDSQLPPHVPDTGDSTNTMMYVKLMCVSGLGLVIIGIFYGRKKR